MKFIRKKTTQVIFYMLAVICLGCMFTQSGKKVDFSADVKPIINKNCIICHGGVKAKHGFSLLFREDALANTESGRPAIIPGDPGASELIRRISSNDVEERMPYKHERLSNEEISIFRRWIKQGAEWGDHWAYLSVKKVAVPEEDYEWIRNDVDKFILNKLKELKLEPSAQADRATLLRRVCLDLIGIYPGKNIIKEFLENKDSSKAYEVLVDSLLSSPHFGEKWASMWLDIARYADTKGYEADRNRTIWQYRDWVIRAFNEDKPYNEFLTEQIAGDLLPDPTDAQYIATAFHRNTMNNDEGGTDNEEFRLAAAMDRVSTTWQGLMGTTFACVQCHSHPYDPFRNDEYYKFLAYFNNTRDEDVPGEYPVFRDFNDTMKQEMKDLLAWIKEKSSVERAASEKKFLLTRQPSINSTTADSLTNAVIGGNNAGLFFRNNAVARLKQVYLQDMDLLVLDFYSNKNGGVMELRLDKPDGPLLASWNISPVKNNGQTISVDFPAQTGTHDVYLRYRNPKIKSKEDFLIFFDWFHFTKQLPGKGKAGFEANKNAWWKLVRAKTPTTPVMIENPESMKRKTHVFERGNWHLLGKEVNPAVPKHLSFAMPANAPANRMGLTMWLTDKRNPLVSRTIVNRLWEQLFGTGIAETLEDLGTQGIPPTHQELLDHLSWKLMNDHKWSIKKLLKELVMSATYRQESKMRDDLHEIDPYNKFYARGPRVRLSAEQIRDQHLFISGKLSTKMYGPPVMPWQPEGIWLSPYNDSKWVMSKGEDQYRRAVYTFLKRTALYPSMISLDAAERVVCVSRRIRTNTPLQALVTLNDSVFVDLSRNFAYRMQEEGGKNVQQQIAKGYELMLFKKITPAKLKIFYDLYQQALKKFKIDEDKTCGMIGEHSKHTNPETAALVVVANAMLNVDEIIMKN